MTDKIIKTINQNRQVKSSINPKALQRSENVITSTNLYVRNRPEIIYQQNISSMAVWDNPATEWDGGDANDQWDTYSTSGKSIIRITNKNNTFYENFDYDGLKGASTTCTWSTSNANASFTSGQILHIASAFKDASNTQVVTKAQLTVTSASGSYDYAMSADGGSHWETVSNGVEHTFTNTGSNLQIKVTENNSSTGVVNLVKCKYTFQ